MKISLGKLFFLFFLIAILGFIFFKLRIESKKNMENIEDEFVSNKFSSNRDFLSMDDKDQNLKMDFEIDKELDNIISFVQMDDDNKIKDIEKILDIVIETLNSSIDENTDIGLYLSAINEMVPFIDKNIEIKLIHFFELQKLIYKEKYKIGDQIQIAEILGMMPENISISFLMDMLQCKECHRVVRGTAASELSRLKYNAKAEMLLFLDDLLLERQNILEDELIFIDEQIKELRGLIGK